MDHDQAFAAIIGAMLAAMLGLISIPVWTLAGADLMYWFIFTCWILAPIGGFVGWRKMR